MHKQIFEAYQKRTVAANEFHLLNFNQMATIIWAFTSVKFVTDSHNAFWNAYMQHLEDLINSD